MKQLSITKIAWQNMGDHAIEAHTPYEYIPGETVENLVARVFGLNEKWAKQPEDIDHIVIQMVVPAPAAEDPDAAKDPWS